MNIGILVPSPKGGGVFQYALSIVDCLSKYSKKYNYYVICSDSKIVDWLDNTELLNTNSVICLPKKKSSIINKISMFLNLALNKNIFNTQRKEEIVHMKNIDLLIIPYPSLFGYRNHIPYIVSIPDMMHKYYPSFPEYPFRERLARDIIYKNSAKHSLLTIVDDYQGVCDLNKFYKIPKEKIRVIPYIPPGYVYKYKDMSLSLADNLLAEYNLPDKFLFYPAQFWYHKNHIGLMKALKIIKHKYGIKVYLVLVGSPKESFNKIMNFIKENNLVDQVIYLGYVTDEQIVALYKKAYALVYPSLFGPTNIPPLEAMILGTPVLCSKLFSMPEQVGEAGLLFDPHDTEDMAEKIYRIWTDEALRRELIQKGYERVKGLTLENYAKEWEKVIEEALTMRK